jgi:hypothetical protein
MASDVQDQLASDEGQSFDRPINVSVIEKLKKFPFMQELGFNGQLSFARDTFHGLGDFNRQMTIYSGTIYVLMAPFAAIRALIPFNAEVTKNLFISRTLGLVGNAFRKLVGFDQVFTVSPDELKTGGSAAITNKLPV